MAACASEAGGSSTTIAEQASTTSPATTTSSPPASTTSTAGVTTTFGGTATTTAENPDGAEGSGCAPGSDTSLPDGRWYGYVISSTETTIDFDLACWFSGEAAIDAAAEDGEESPPPNDYYVRNENDRTRTIDVPPETVVVFYPTGDPTGETSGTFADWRAMVGERGPFFGVWLDVVDGEVSAMTEQWVP
ncbi:MAG TPA: hypothetical protein VIC07_06880 [Acidimicrobiia bacterium]